MNRFLKLRRLASTYYHYRRHHESLPYFPLRLWIESSNQCNLRCSVCPNSTDTTSARGNLDPKLFRDMLDQAPGLISDINLSHRGEPLYHPDLEELITIANRRQIGTRIHTNATLLEPERAQKLLSAGPDLVSFSFDGFDKPTYESVRIGGIFEKTLANIEYFLRSKHVRNLKKPYTILQIIEPTDITDAYRAGLQDFGDSLRTIGLDKFYIKKPHNWGGNASGEVQPQAGFIPCTFLYYSMTVLWDGTVCPCPQDWYATMQAGNATKQSLREIWNGELLKDMRSRMKERRLEGLLCASCDRIYRPSVLGVPRENIKAFMGETIAGYDIVRRIIRK